MKLKPLQRTALQWMSKKPLTYTVAGFCCDLRPAEYWHTRTIESLQTRGLCVIHGTGLSRIARITKAGRRELGGEVR